MRPPSGAARRALVVTLTLYAGAVAAGDAGGSFTLDTGGGGGGVLLTERAPPRNGDSGLRITAVDQDAPPGQAFTVTAHDVPLGPLGMKGLLARGVIDPLDAKLSVLPGLMPLAQSRQQVGGWMAAVDRAGPLTPLSDPLFAGTVFIPTDDVLSAALGSALRNSSSSGVGSRMGAAGGGGKGPHRVPEEQVALAALLNSLTVPGQPLRFAEITAAAQVDGGAVRLRSFTGDLVLAQTHPGDGRRPGLSVAPVGGPAGAVSPIIEPNLQSGGSIAHVVGDALDGRSPFAGPAADGNSPAGGAAAARPAWFPTAMAALRDQRVGAARFAALAEAAGLGTALSDEAMRVTVFAPSDKALEALLPAGFWDAVPLLPEGLALAEALVNGHWVSGAALGSLALRERAAAGVDVTVADGRAVTVELSRSAPRGVEAVVVVESAPSRGGSGSVKRLAAGVPFWGEAAAQPSGSGGSSSVSVKAGSPAKEEKCTQPATNSTGSKQEKAKQPPSKQQEGVKQKQNKAPPVPRPAAPVRGVPGAGLRLIDGTPQERKGSLVLGDLPIAAPDAGLGPRSAVHVINGVLDTPHLREHLSLFSRALSEVGVGGRRPAGSLSGEGEASAAGTRQPVALATAAVATVAAAFLICLAA